MSTVFQSRRRNCTSLITLENVRNVRLESFVTDALIVVDAKVGHNRKDRQIGLQTQFCKLFQCGSNEERKGDVLLIKTRRNRLRHGAWTWMWYTGNDEAQRISTESISAGKGFIEHETTQNKMQRIVKHPLYNPTIFSALVKALVLHN